MRISAARLVRVLMLAVLVMALAVPATAGAGSRSTGRAALASVPMVALDADGNGNIPEADAIPASPVNSTLTLTIDESDPLLDSDDVYVVNLVAGQTLSARVSTAVSGTDCDLYLFGPTATDIFTDEPLATAELEYTNPDMLWDLDDGDQFVAPTTGTYYLDVFMIDAPEPDTAYNYTLDYAIGEAPEVTIASSASTVSFGGPVTITGVVRDADTDAPLAGQAVELWSVGYPSYDFTRKVSGVVTAGDGSFTFSTSVTRWTFFKVVAVTNGGGYSYGASAEKGVKAKVALGAPKWYTGTKYHGRSFTVYGYIKPRHPLGQKHVKITASRLDSGVWKVAKNVSNTSTHTKFSTTIILPYAGKWKLVASTPDDGYHAATTSSATYVTVK